MKFIPLRDFDIVASALNFDTPDCHVSGGCDLYTTKAAGSDKKLYKNIDKSLESQHAALLKLGASLSPPQREEMAASHMLSRSSPFGNLAEISSRRTFAYLIATLNASHPDYDFSHVLRPADFRRERNLRKVMSLIDSTLSNVRPSSLVLDSTLGSMAGASVGSSSAASTSTSPLWGPQMWALISKEMHLQDCTVFSYQPDNSPFDEEDGAIWTMHYFFFSKPLKRVAYMYVRGVPVMSHSPQLLPRHHQRRMSHHHYLMGSSIAIAGGRSRLAHRRGSRSSRMSSGAADENGLSALSSSAKRPSLTFQESNASDGAGGANKRARYWLGDKYADRLISPSPGDEVEDEDEEMDEVLLWRPDDDSDVDDYGGGDGGFIDDDDDVSVLDSSMEDEEVEEEEEDEEGGEARDQRDRGSDSQNRKGPVRAMSEEIAARMDME